MNPARRGTPESEAVASSEDERPWPSSMSFGKFPMKEDVPGLPGGIWANKRPSFKMSETAQRNAAREARLGAVNPAHAAALRGTPSPSSAGDGSGSLPFAIPLQPTPKTGRSLSHSQGQREAALGASGGQHASAGAGQGPQLPLGLLAEEVDTESDSEMDNVLTHTNSHPPIGSSLARTATLPATYGYQGPSNGRDNGNGRSPPHQGISRGKTFESAFANLSLEHPRHRAQWQSHLGWDDVVNVNESRRHSLADIPTRRGSLAGGEPSHLSRAFTIDDAIEDEPSQYQHFGADRDTATDHHAASRVQRTSNIIPPMYIAPPVELTAREQGEMDAQRQMAAAQGINWGPGNGRPKKQLYVVSFKCSRVDVFYLLDNTGLTVKEGDMVIVEADRGQDLGTVQHAKVTPDAARLLKKKYSEEQYKWLMMYSRNKEGGFNPNAQLHGENEGSGRLFPDAPTTMQGSIPRDNYNNLKPKAIKRLANEHEIKMLAEKEGNEAKAKRTCQQKVAHLRLQMEILDAEWQWDFQKLIFYYYADHYINFKDLITELYRIYKTRIWLSAINPASFSQHAMGQPPSGIGPGAVAPFNPYAMNNSYTMAYGEDRDPYGAQMPYRIPYETYTPNYPAIPGVANSFAPPATFPNGQNYMFFGPGGNAPAQGMMTPSPQMGEDTTPTSAHAPAPRSGNLMDYNFFPSSDEHYSIGNKNVAPQMGFVPPEMAGLPRPDSFSKQSESIFAPAYNAQHQTQQGPGAPNSPWATKAGNSAAGTSRANNFPNPIGTARPTSQGQDFGRPGDGGRRATVDFTAQFRGLDMSRGQAPGRPNFLADSAHPNNGSRAAVEQAFNYQNVAKGSRKDQEEAAGRVGTMDRYFSQLPPPTDMSNMHADEMSRER